MFFYKYIYWKSYNNNNKRLKVKVRIKTIKSNVEICPGNTTEIKIRISLDKHVFPKNHVCFNQ